MLTFKKINDLDCHYYKLDLDDRSSYIEYHIEYNGNVITGNAIKLHEFWIDRAFSNEIKEICVDPITFASEFYLVNLGEGVPNKVSNLINKGLSAIIDEQYKDPVQNEILDSFSDLTTPQAECKDESV